jgi:hypothetical protein
MAERGGFEQSQSGTLEANLNSNTANDQLPASLPASLKQVHVCPDLSEFCQAWPKLPVDMQTAILALMRATLNSTTQ